MLYRDGNGREMLFILRASRVNDPWSGHVAFPGGRRATGEEDLETCLREVKEEIGIDLSQTSLARFCGELDTQTIFQNKKPFLSVVGFSFEIRGDPLLNPDPKEVQCAVWVPIRAITNPAVVLPFIFEIKGPSDSASQRMHSRWRRVIGLSNVVQPSVSLLDASSHKKFILWGLTLGMAQTAIGMRPLELRHPNKLLDKLGVKYRFTERTGILNILWTLYSTANSRIEEKLHFSYHHARFSQMIDIVSLLIGLTTVTGFINWSSS
jgi:8-oxo-dGTP pyrophosphatase MutT (NUDIX family)